MTYEYDDHSGATSAVRRGRDPLANQEVESRLRRASELIGAAKQMPLSSSVMVNRDELMDLLNSAIQSLPAELKHARWLLKERDEFLRRVQSEGDEILDQASAKAEAMVQQKEVVKQAEARARQIVAEAQDDARRIRLECEDFCDQRLAQFEIVLNRTMKMVHAGREKLNAGPVAMPGDGLGRPRTGEVSAVSPDEVPSGGFGRPAEPAPERLQGDSVDEVVDLNADVDVDEQDETSLFDDEV